MMALKGACLTCFIELYGSVVQFLLQQKDIYLRRKLKLIKTDAFIWQEYSRNVLSATCSISEPNWRQ